MKITVAVPTIAGRGKYLESCLATCTSQSSDDLEILVSDNSEGDARDLVASLGDPRIRYIRPPQYLPMSAHWDFVLANASGDVITFIGDDDGLMPNCITRVSEILHAHGLVPLHHSLCNYYWPDYLSMSDCNTAVFYHSADGLVRWVNSVDFLSGICRGQLRYVDGPMVYHNFIPRLLLQNLTRNGVFFRRSSPDVYSSIAIAHNVERFVSVGEILTVSGQGARANGASVRVGGDDGRKFLLEMESQLYRSRFRSKTIQLQLLDALMEVATEFSSARLIDQVTYAPHLLRALNEVRFFPGWRVKMRETVEILRIAINRGAMTEVLALIGSRVLKRMRRAIEIGEIESVGSKLPYRAQVNDRIKFSSQVTDIYQATLALSRIVTAP